MSAAEQRLVDQIAHAMAPALIHEIEEWLEEQGQPRDES